MHIVNAYAIIMYLFVYIITQAGVSMVSIHTPSHLCCGYVRVCHVSHATLWLGLCHPQGG